MYLEMLRLRRQAFSVIGFTPSQPQMTQPMRSKRIPNMHIQKSKKVESFALGVHFSVEELSELT